VNLKDRVIEKLFNQFKSLQKAFVEMNKSKSGFITPEEFEDLIKGWGFEAPTYLIREVFDWIDFDRDGKITFEDLRATVGQDLAPKEALYFR
jgi:Ca2+-binding EF-hand superfamily protein